MDANMIPLDNKQVMTLDNKAVEFTDQPGLVAAALFIQSAKWRIKAIEEEYQRNAVEYFKARPELKEIEMGNDVILYMARDKKEKFKTQKIYDLFKFSLEQQCILEKNPGFRKKELARASGMDVKDADAEFVDVEWQETVKVKTLDKKFIGGK